MKKVMRLDYKKIALKASFLLIFTGCSSTLPLAKNENSHQLPNWYINAPANNPIHLYGIGESNSLESAKNMALNNMAARLSVTVGSKLEQKTTSSSNGTYKKDVSQNLNIEVQNIKFNNAKVEKNHVAGNNFFVLMRVSRTELFNDKKKDFDLSESKINNALKISKNQSILEKVYTLENTKPILNKARSQAILLNAIDNDFDDLKYLKKYDNISNDITSLKDSLKIKITSNTSSKLFSDELIDELNKNSYKVVNYNDNVKISLNNKINYSTARGWKIAKVNTTISVISNGRTISNNIINSVGRSSSSNENALASAASYFKDEVTQLGLNTILFNK